MWSAFHFVSFSHKKMMFFSTSVSQSTLSAEIKFWNINFFHKISKGQQSTVCDMLDFVLEKRHITLVFFQFSLINLLIYWDLLIELLRFIDLHLWLWLKSWIILHDSPIRFSKTWPNIDMIHTMAILEQSTWNCFYLTVSDEKISKIMGQKWLKRQQCLWEA